LMSTRRSNVRTQNACLTTPKRAKIAIVTTPFLGSAAPRETKK
jgi:hypothetical protein